MDVVHDRASIIVEEEDRISNLADDIIHHILSFIDMKYAIQTSTLSKRWEHIWTSMPVLNLNNQMFRTLHHFAKFVTHVLSHRNHHIEVSAVDLSIRGATAKCVVVQSIVKYAYSHNVKQLTVEWVPRTNFEFPQYLFSSHTLKHLTVANNEQRRLTGGCISKSVWDFPALETLNLSNIKFGKNGNENLDLFSKCVNLKDLILHRCSMYPLKSFNVCAPQLCNLAITDPYDFPLVFNLVAPQLENLTASVKGHVIGSLFLRLSTTSLGSLKKVNLLLSSSHSSLLKKHAPHLLPDLFQKLCSAKFLILDIGVVEALSSCIDQLSHKPCPFNNLKCLEINAVPLKQRELKFRNYFLESSPSVTFNMNLPQVSFKRLREEVDKNTLANKVAKLEEEKQKKDEVIAQQKAMLEAMNLQHEKLMSQMINRKMAELQVQVEGGDPDYKLIRSMGGDIKTIMELIPESLRVAMEAQLSCRYEEVKRLFLTRVDASQWPRIETEMGITGHSERINSNVRVGALSSLPLPSSANVATSSTQAFLGD